MKKDKPTYDFICFSELAHEFDVTDVSETEGKIKRRLKYYNLDHYNPERIAVLRQLKKDLYSEIGKGSNSKYYVKKNDAFADIADFSGEDMASDYHKKYPQIAMVDLKRIVNFAIYLYYVR